MPEIKGKRRNRPGHRQDRRSRSTRSITEVNQMPVQDGARQVRSKPKIQTPLWLNTMIGVLMVLAGFVFFIVDHKRMSTGTELLIFAGYIAVGALYLFKAYRQYRERQT